MRNRIIPVLLMDQRHRLVKTVRFGERTYVGDPFNVIRLFNEKEVDEICLLDIDASTTGAGPDLGFVRELASECFMPLAYGGGLSTPDQCERLNRVGVEKFVLGRSTIDSELVRHLVRDLGSQAVVACVDVKGSGSSARCVTNSGRKRTNLDALTYALQLQDLGVGEIILQSVDRDGTRTGYDLELIRHVAPQLSIPTVALGGAGEPKHLADAIRAGASAAASGSTFVFLGRLRAVLISYPSARSMNDLFGAPP